MRACICACGAVVWLSAVNVWAQDAPSAPMSPATSDHDVHRMGTQPEAAAPPALPPDEIIRKFSQKEDEYLAVRGQYGYKKTIRIDEYDHQGKVAGEFLLVTQTARGSSGQLYNKVIEHPQSTLQSFTLEPEDAKEFDRIPAFPLTTSQLVKYDLKFIGQETLDEIDAYIFQVKPKTVERDKAFFEGVVWVDTKYLEVVKTYGKWVNELGDVHIGTMPFTMFETYRENVDGKYWLPDYVRSDDTLHSKDMDVPVRVVIKWTDFKPLSAITATTTPAGGAAAPPETAAPPPKP